jgi:dihydrofolate reductase
MRKIIMLNRISLDGYFASQNEENWGMDWFVFDPEVDKAAHAIGEPGAPLPLLLLGGNTYRGLERSWVPHLTNPSAPQQLKAVAEELTGMTKLVFSKSLKEVTWKNTRLFSGNLIEEIKKLKKEKGPDIMIMGSGTIIQQLANENLMDDYAFIISPVISGGGKPLFKDVHRSELKLISSQSFNSGNLLVHYTTNK